MTLDDVKNLYSYLWFNFITRGRFIKKDYLDGMSINTAYDKIITKQAFKQVINIYKYPLDYSNCLDDMILLTMYENHPRVEVSINDMYRPTSINLKNKNTIDEYKRVMSQYESYKAQYDDLGTAEKQVGKRIIEGQRVIKLNKRFVETLREKAESYDYAFKHSGYFFISYKFVEIVAENQRDLDSAVEAIEKMLRPEEISFQSLAGELGDYLRNFSPSGYKGEETCQPIAMLMSDENIASQSCYADLGVIGSFGVCIGRDVITNAQVFVSFTEGETGQNIAVIGKTGSGKTAEIINMINSLLCNIRYYICVMDYKGNEYTPLLEIYDGIEIKLSECYVNFLRLDTLDNNFTRSEKIELYEEAVNGTVSLFTAMTCLDISEGSPVDMERLVRQAVIKVFDMNDVIKENVHSYKNAYRCKYRDVLEVLRDMVRLSTYSDKEKQIMHFVITRAEEFLDPTGSKNYMFKTELDFNTVLRSRLVIYNFGKNNNSADFTVEDNIRFLMMRFVNNKKTMIVKKAGNWIYQVYEELQRSGEGFIVREVNHDVTGQRSNNKTTILAFNSLNFLLQVNRDAYAIASNITTFCVGLIEQKEFGYLIDLFNVTEIQDRVYEIMQNPDKHKHEFVWKINTGVTIDTAQTKFEMPPDILESDLFVTRDVEKVVV